MEEHCPPTHTLNLASTTIHPSIHPPPPPSTNPPKPSEGGCRLCHHVKVCHTKIRKKKKQLLCISSSSPLFLHFPPLIPISKDASNGHKLSAWQLENVITRQPACSSSLIFSFSLLFILKAEHLQKCTEEEV